MTCKTKSLAGVGSGEDSPMLKSEIWNRLKVVSMRKSCLLGILETLVIYEDMLKDV